MRLLALLLLFVVGVANAELIASYEHGTDSVAVRFALWDQDTPDTCPSADIASTNLTIGVTANNEASEVTYAGAKILTIATPGTYSAPTNSDEIRFGVVDAGSCLYELQLRNERLDVVGAERLDITIQDSGGDMMEAWHWIDLTPVTQDTLIAALLATDCSSYNTTDTVGSVLCDSIAAILTDTGTTLDDKLDAIVADTGTDIPSTLASLRSDQALWVGAVDTVTSQTILIATDGPPAADMHVGRSLCIKDGSDSQAMDCALITDYNEGTLTFTLANALDFTVASGDVMVIPAQDANVKAMNSSEVCGNGTTGNAWTGNGC